MSDIKREAQPSCQYFKWLQKTTLYTNLASLFTMKFSIQMLFKPRKSIRTFCENLCVSLSNIKTTPIWFPLCFACDLLMFRSFSCLLNDFNLTWHRVMAVILYWSVHRVCKYSWNNNSNNNISRGESS